MRLMSAESIDAKLAELQTQIADIRRAIDHLTDSLGVPRLKMEETHGTRNRKERPQQTSSHIA